MKVILLQDVKAQGKKGEIVNVSDGYFKNFLAPKKLAVEANTQNMSVLNSQKSAAAHKIDVERAQATDIKDKLEKLNLSIIAKAGANGKLFGTITSKEISQVLKEKENIEIDKRKIVLSEPIKAFGGYVCDVKLYEKITAKLKVFVKEQ